MSPPLTDEVGDLRGYVPGLDRGTGTLLAAGDFVQHLAEAVHVQLEQRADCLQRGGGYPEYYILQLGTNVCEDFKSLLGPFAC